MLHIWTLDFTGTLGMFWDTMSNGGGVAMLKQPRPKGLPLPLTLSQTVCTIKLHVNEKNGR